MKNLTVSILILICFITTVNAQPGVQKSGPSYSSFIDYQKSFQRPGEALLRKEDTLQKQFAAKGLKWPAKYIYIRSFKYDSQMEVWVKNEIKEPFQLFKTYKVCALAGTLGPKRIAGDYQVPEGFYYINEFNPQSNYYYKYKQLPDVLIDDKRNYIVNGAPPRSGTVTIKEEKPVKRTPVQHRVRDIPVLVHL